ncbi:MAG: rubredoxin [Methanomicrobiales archaeon]|nr:rubredoxin [Methanomicrobiales archaeon]
MATSAQARTKRSVKKTAPASRKNTRAAKKPAAAPKKTVVAKKPAKVKTAAGSRKTATGKITGATGSKKKVVKKPVKTGTKKPVAKGAKTSAKKGKSTEVVRYRCRLCGYIYSPLRGEPHNGIPAGTAFDDLPKSYVCPVCGQQGKGRIGKWGFDEWRPTRYLCSICNYIYDEKRGEPHRGIKPGTKFEDLPDDYVCPVCALDPKIKVRFGKVFKQGFEPLQL